MKRRSPPMKKDSGLRGSNPSNWLGKPGHYHYAKPATVESDRSTPQSSAGERSPTTQTPRHNQRRTRERHAPAIKKKTSPPAPQATVISFLAERAGRIP